MSATTLDQWLGETRNPERADNGNVVEHIAHLPTHEEIEHRAYEIFLRNGAQEGHSEQDWLEAQRELLQEIHNTNAFDEESMGALGEGTL